MRIGRDIRTNYPRINVLPAQLKTAQAVPSKVTVDREQGPRVTSNKKIENE